MRHLSEGWLRDFVSQGEGVSFGKLLKRLDVGCRKAKYTKINPFYCERHIQNLEFITFAVEVLSRRLPQG